jgi:class 3 adenylate cyclase
MECPECKYDNPDEANFCLKCGTKLISSAPDLESFNEKLDKIQRYLPEGLSQKILEQKDRIEGERKQVTVLFCDMVGFTPFSEKLGPEKTYNIMDKVLEILIHKVHDYGGTVNQLTGDGLYALFGIPIAIEDAASRAIRAGIDMHKDIAEFSNKMSKEKDIPPIRFRVGVNSGPVVVGTVGNSLRVDFTAVGDTVNLASRMEGIAEPETVYVTEETYKQSRLYFEFEFQGEKQVKGKEEPVIVYKVISEKEKVHRRPTSERIIQSEMVGRENELDKLALLALKAKDGEGSIVNIIGEAGIGKSRLISEFSTHDAVKRATVLEGRALSMGRNLSFYPIIEILKEFSGIGEDDKAAEQLFKLEKAVQNIHPDNADEIIPFIGSLMGMQLSGKYAERVKSIDGEALEKLIYKNLRDFILKSAEVSPLIFIMEDLHWADSSSLDLITSLCRLAENNRILIINIFRPYYEETSEKLREALSEEYSDYYTEINLHRLDSNQSDQLIDNLLNIEGLPTDMRDQIKEKSEGNPFFIEEMARSMIDEGAIEIQGGKFTVTKKIDEVVVPNTVQELLMSRIDRLDEKTKSLLRIASVIGRHFFHKILTEVLETVEDIDNKLGYLQEIQLIREGKRMEEVEYLFKHALAQEATYESILQEKRKALHLRVAESFEKVFSERLSEFYGMLAFHFIKAESLDKAEEYMLRAGEEAMKASASSEALHYYQNAMQLYQDNFGDMVDPSKMADLHGNIADAFYYKGFLPEALKEFDITLEYLGEKPPKTKIAWVLKTILGLYALLKIIYLPSISKKKTPPTFFIRFINISHKRGNILAVTNTTQYFFQSIGLIWDINRYDIIGHQNLFDLLTGCSTLFSFTGISMKLAEKMLDYLNYKVSEGGSHLSLSLFNGQKQFFNHLSGNWRDEYEGNSINGLLSKGDTFSASAFLYFYVFKFNQMGLFSNADTCIKILDGIINEYQDDYTRNAFYLSLIQSIAKAVDLSRFEKYAEECRQFFEKADYEQSQIMVLSAIGQIFTLLKNFDKAVDSINQANRIVEKIGITNIPPAFYLYFLLSEFRHFLSRSIDLVPTEDKTEYNEIMKRLSKIEKAANSASRKSAVHNTEFNRLKAIYQWFKNNQKKALKWFDKSIKEGERLGARPDLSRTYMEVGKRLMEPKSKYKHLNGITANEYLEKAKVLFEEMDLQWDLEQLEKVKRGEQVPIV